MAIKPPYIKKNDEIDDLKVWVIDGALICQKTDEEFTNFGQHYRNTYIPKDELWLDREAGENERKHFIDHLLVEHRLMEYHLRHHPDELHDALAADGWA